MGANSTWSRPAPTLLDLDSLEKVWDSPRLGSDRVLACRPVDQPNSPNFGWVGVRVYSSVKAGDALEKAYGIDSD